MESLAQSRSRRQRVDKTGRSAAFERLRQAKEQGSKSRLVVEDERSVYDIVEEGEYSDMVRLRQEEDWIIDDDGTGYVEDGREIFDDDMDEESVDRGTQKDIKRRKKNMLRPGTKPKRDIMALLAAVSDKKKSEKDVSVAEDAILGGLMEELRDRPNTSGPPAVKSSTYKSCKVSVNPFSLEANSRSREAVHCAPYKDTCSTTRPIIYEDGCRLHVPVVKSNPSTLASESSSRIVDYVSDHDNDVGMEGVEPKVVERSIEPGLECFQEEPMDLQGINFDDVMEESSVAEEGQGFTKLNTAPDNWGNGDIQVGWEDISCHGNGTGIIMKDSVTNIQVESYQFPLVEDRDGNNVLRFYWLDAYEDAFNHPGSVYLFGKVWMESANSFVSCCVHVRNLERRVYVLPRLTKYDCDGKVDTGQPVTMVQVYEEFNSRVAEKYKITKFKSKADLPLIPSDVCGQTFSRVFGSHTSSLENLLLDRKMKGPCWLDIWNPCAVRQAFSWCKIEAEVLRSDDVVVGADVPPAPPLVIMSISLRTLPKQTTHQNEIISVAALIHNSFPVDKPAPSSPLYQNYFSVIIQPHNTIFPFDFREKLRTESKKMKVEIMPTERGLVAYLLAKIHTLDPDVIVGHDIYGFDLDILLHRISANKVPHWSKLGRLKRSIMPRHLKGVGNSLADKYVMSGRLLCDVKLSARELLRCKGYDLSELSSHILHVKRPHLDYEDIRQMYETSSSLLHLMELLLLDATYTLRIVFELNIVPLALHITNICGNVLSRTLLGGRSERNEFLLLHAFTERSYICPDKHLQRKGRQLLVDGDMDGEAGRKGQTGRRKPTYAGGLVLEPKTGFYDKYILLLDFNSLYPSIIQEYNICFTTVIGHGQGMDEELDIAVLPPSDSEAGVLPAELRRLVESRRQVKGLMKSSNLSPEQILQYSIREKALKLTANSMYGCLGFPSSRFYARPLAALVTKKGREILLKTKQLVEGLGLDVIYGDTDSIMVNTNSEDLEQVSKLGNKIKAEVNKHYRLLEIDIDAIYKSMLLLKKKKYAALSVCRMPDGTCRTEREMKGLDIVRRDWCDLAKEAGKFVVDLILSGEQRDVVVETIHGKLRAVSQQVRSNQLPVDLFIINKQLTKNPEDYPDKNHQSHVQVALRINSWGGKKLRAGDTVCYVICDDGSQQSATHRAYHPDELGRSESLQLDTHYYLAHQIHPVVSRLCSPISGTDPSHLAECLGLDPSSYHQRSDLGERGEEGEISLSTQTSEGERFRDCSAFRFVCPTDDCRTECVVYGVFIARPMNGADGKMPPTYTLSECRRVGCNMKPWQHICYLRNRLQRDIGVHIKRYYDGWMRCDDSGCATRSRKLPLSIRQGQPLCGVCKQGTLKYEYSDTALYNQLSFYMYVFDVDKARSLLSPTDRVSLDQQHPPTVDLSKAYHELKATVQSYLQFSSYSQVDLGALFQDVFVIKP